MKCPKCNFVQTGEAAECKRCGVIFAKVANDRALADSFDLNGNKNRVSLPSRPVMYAIIAGLIGVAGFTVPIFTSNSGDGPVYNPDEARAIEAKAYGLNTPDGLTKLRKLDTEARLNYEAAKKAVIAQDFSTAIDRYTEAIEFQSDFLEAFYNRGSARMQLSLAALLEGNRSESLRHFRSAVTDKKTAHKLMDEDRWYIYLTEADRTQVRTDVEEGLKNIDQILSDDDFAYRTLRCVLGDCR